MIRKFSILALCALVLAPRPAAPGFPVVDLPGLAQALRDMVLQQARNAVLNLAKETADAARQNAVALATGTPGSWDRLRDLIGSLKRVQALTPSALKGIASYGDAATLVGFADPAALTPASIEAAWDGIAALDTSGGVFTTVLAAGKDGVGDVARYTARREARAANRGTQAAAAAARAQTAAELAKIAIEAAARNDANRTSGVGALPSLTPGNEPSPAQKQLAAQVTLNNLMVAIAQHGAVESRLAAAETERVQRESAAQATAQAAVARARQQARQAWTDYVPTIADNVDRGNQLLAWVGTYSTTAEGVEAGPPSVTLANGTPPNIAPLPATIGGP